MNDVREARTTKSGSRSDSRRSRRPALSQVKSCARTRLDVEWLTHACLYNRHTTCWYHLRSSLSRVAPQWTSVVGGRKTVRRDVLSSRTPPQFAAPCTRGIRAPVAPVRRRRSVIDRQVAVRASVSTMPDHSPAARFARRTSNAAVSQTGDASHRGDPAGQDVAGTHVAQFDCGVAGASMPGCHGTPRAMNGIFARGRRDEIDVSGHRSSDSTTSSQARVRWNREQRFGRAVADACLNRSAPVILSRDRCGTGSDYERLLLVEPRQLAVRPATPRPSGA